MQTKGPVTIPFTIQPQTGVVKVAGPMDYDEGIKVEAFFNSLSSADNVCKQLEPSSKTFGLIWIQTV